MVRESPLKAVIGLFWFRSEPEVNQSFSPCQKLSVDSKRLVVKLEPVLAGWPEGGRTTLYCFSGREWT